MRIVTRLIQNVNKKEVEQLSKPDNCLVKEISSNDGIKFDNEGIPHEFTLDIHQITKRNFTPLNVYNDPPFYPWAEPNRHKKVEKAENTVSQEPVIESKPIELQTGEISVYNGYPIKFNVSDKTIIAINNRGDTIFTVNNVYILHGKNDNILQGKFVEVLDCNVYTREHIAEIQEIVWYV